MEALNLALFDLINASPNVSSSLLLFAQLSAVQLIWLIPVLLVVGWLRGSESLKLPLIEAFMATLLALAASWLIGLIWPTPRPFVMSVGEHLLEHEATPAFPSNHLTIILTVAFSLLLHAHTRRIGCYLLLLAVPVAWARIFLGVHFPQDMLGAMLLAATTSILVGANRTWLVLPFYQHVAKRLYHLLFAALIKRGWIQR